MWQQITHKRKASQTYPFPASCQPNLDPLALCFRNQNGQKRGGRARVPQNKMPRSHFSLWAAMKFTPAASANGLFPPPPLRKYIRESAPSGNCIAWCVGCAVRRQEVRCMTAKQTSTSLSLALFGPICPSISSTVVGGRLESYCSLFYWFTMPGAITKENGPSWNSIKNRSEKRSHGRLITIIDRAQPQRPEIMCFLRALSRGAVFCLEGWATAKTKRSHVKL